jgi:hypothetical protein
MTRDQADEERGQLLAHWKGLLERCPDWTTTNRFYQIEKITEGQSSTQAPDWLRAFHNKLGFKALGTLSKGGLCAGAIFRTQSFMNTKNRIGSRSGQSVHIEHTVPICVLREQIQSRSFSNYSETLVWILKHSVTTAFNHCETEHLKGMHIATKAFDRMLPEQKNKPFLRYKALFDSKGEVWNVLTGEPIKPDRFTFNDHIEAVIQLLNTAGASRTLVNQIEEHKSVT